MKTSLNIMVLVVSLTLTLLNSSILADQLDFGFKNPAFSGNGYSNHVLSVDQLQSQRKKDNEAEAKSAAAAKAREEKNTTINKFIANVESRIYANLSKQLVDNMLVQVVTVQQQHVRQVVHLP